MHVSRYKNDYMAGPIDSSYSQARTEWLSEDPVLNSLEHEPLTPAQGRKLMMDMLEVRGCVHSTDV